MKNETINGNGGHNTIPQMLKEDQLTRKHLNWVAQHHNNIRRLQDETSRPVQIRGENLSPADLIAVACHGARSEITSDPQVLEKINASVDFLNKELEMGRPVYGISTGFGGSADTRTSQFHNLQKALVQHQHSGILIPRDVSGLEETIGIGASEALSALRPHSLPRTVVRGAMLARCNSLMRGHSAVRRDVIAALMKLLNLDFIPVVPLRGSISASGDLSPLSYLAGTLEGNPGIYVDCVNGTSRKVLSADQALYWARIEPIALGPKEGLGIVNGTTVSCAAATFGLHETQYLALMTQALTGMCTEALRGSVDNFHPFIAETRPHAGHIEAAANISRFLEGSKISGSHYSGTRTAGLCQDRYALRTAGQWLGPYLEDLCLAAQQLEIELNSTTDNPLLDVAGQRIHHGGNFQATSVTSAIEKTRLALQMFGKLLFAQNSELINPALNGNLPPNLCFDDPSLSFTFKGVDINMAAYMSELAFLANPVSSHVQPAEMSNQAVNSLALISARYTADAVEVVSLMCAAHLYSLCQALDLQAMWLEIMKKLREELGFLGANTLMPSFSSSKDIFGPMMEVIEKSMIANRSKDLDQLAQATADSVGALLYPMLQNSETTEDQVAQLASIPPFVKKCKEMIITCISGVRRQFAKDALNITPMYLSNGSKKMYHFVRNDLGVRLHLGLIEHPTYTDESPIGIKLDTDYKPTVGEWIAKIYCAIRDGRIHGVLVDSLL